MRKHEEKYLHIKKDTIIVIFAFISFITYMYSLVKIGTILGNSINQIYLILLLVSTIILLAIMTKNDE